MPSVTGNIWLFKTFRVCTIMLVIVGLGNIAAGVSVCVNTGDFDLYTGSYIFLGFFLVLLAIFGHTTRESLGGLTFYLLCLLATFVAESGFTIGIILYTGYDSILGDAYVETVRVTMAGACIFILVGLIVGLWYRSSLKYALFCKSNENLIHPQESSEPQPRPSVRREEMEKKYNLSRKRSIEDSE